MVPDAITTYQTNDSNGNYGNLVDQTGAVVNPYTYAGYRYDAVEFKYVYTANHPVNTILIQMVIRWLAVTWHTLYAMFRQG
ncbi:hypothetical protein [Thermoactinomyces sp. CICC 10521]|uniref:hypothetical protein n=1 Tax=Thermoactinomyces sp. CICC 10521 TaxID=2767426 RepID=UPI0018DD9EB2|nr:hypothetical protein [Thermoactinomyces sp. CICC 10521]MBH8608673.1 hypothetical protein [Thermoactinomyces sp. CICC 10521]